MVFYSAHIESICASFSGYYMYNVNAAAADTVDSADSYFLPHDADAL